MDISDGESDNSEARHLANIANYTELLSVITCTYILNPNKVAKSSQLSLVLIDYKENNPKCFHRNLCVSSSTFDSIVKCIEDHAVFSKKSNIEQYPVKIQLAIILYQFGHDANATSVKAMALWAGVSAGMVVKSTCQVSIAVLSLYDQVIWWLSDDEKEEAKAWVEAVSCPA
ncbi:hypothetical protein H0H81_004378 [Sphagnurus paluster]|uniref:Uncharacterized protein n=1 Tax=Sphagnurus paluster TaxID=117069 RepID=A0A9P7KJ73_9AGAR|nr:hypothetical protein H0H81_004378 [Sphagnurus paluster]